MDQTMEDDSKIKILFICSSNRDRSKTAEDIYKDDDHFEVKSAGADADAELQVSKELIRWSDVIVVMNEREDRQKFKLLQRFPFLEPTKKIIIDFDIADNYLRGDPQLIRIIKDKMREFFPEAF
ncbi:MAG: phosphotyrosine protein phosphatase [Patescibacteria group bacterium]